MLTTYKEKIIHVLRWTEKYTKTDMLYLFRGGSWLGFRQVALAILGLVTSIIFANFIDKTDFGTYKFALSLLSLLAIPCLSGMGVALTRAVAQGTTGDIYPVRKEKMLWGAGSVVLAVILGSYYFIVGNYFLGQILIIGSLFVPFLQGFGIYLSYLDGHKDFRRSSLYKVGGQALTTLSVVFGIFIFDSPLVWVIIFMASSTVGNWFYFRKAVKSYSPSESTNSETISYGKHLSFMTLINTVSFHIDKILIFHYLGAAQLAVYSFATLVPEQLKGVSTNLASLALPKFSQKDISENKGMIIKKTALLAGVITIMAVCYIVTAPFIFNILFSQYSEAVIFSQIFALSLIPSAAAVPISALHAHAEKKGLYMLNSYGPFFQIIALAIFTPLFGLLGVVVARSAFRFFIAFHALYLLYKA